LFVSYWTWRGAFFINVPIGIAVLVLALRYIPRDRPPAEQSRFGMAAMGMVLLGIGLLSGMLAVSYLGATSARLGSPTFAALAAVSVAAAWMFFHHIRRSASPFIAPRLIHGPSFGPVNLITTIYGGVTIGAVALVPLYAANRYGIDALSSGTLLIAQG